MTVPDPAVRRRSDGEQTRRRVLDAVSQTIIDVGYYKASSNEIARRAGVTWGALHHLFGSREQLMFEVFRDLGAQFRNRMANARISGDSLAVRLREVLKVMEVEFEQPRFLVEVQILMDLSSNPRVSPETRQAMRHRNATNLVTSVRPLFEQALGADASDEVVLYVFTALNGYLTSRALVGLTADLPSDDAMRNRLVEGVAASVGTVGSR